MVEQGAGQRLWFPLDFSVSRIFGETVEIPAILLN
jgi:hypothetical protein